MKTLSGRLRYSAASLNRDIAVRHPRSVSRTISRLDLQPRLRSGAQASLLAALGAVSGALTLIYILASHPPSLLLLVAPLWSIWLQSFVNWLRRDIAISIPRDRGALTVVSRRDVRGSH